MPATQDNRLLKLVTPLPYDQLLIERISAHESISQLFHYELEIYHEETSNDSPPSVVDPKQLVGKPMTVAVVQKDGDTTVERFFSGMCVRFAQGNRDERWTKYHAIVKPDAWLLTQRQQSRIFQQISVPDILKKVFKGLDVEWQIMGTFHPRDYCVQYRESDWDFAARLMEEEGIYFYFKHKDSGHTMMVANTPQSHLPCPTKERIPFAVNRESIADADWAGSILSWRVFDQIRTGQVTLWDDNFELPGKKLEADKPSRFTIGQNKALELYDYPGGYAGRFDGVDTGGGERASDLQKIFEDNKRTAEIRQQEIDVGYHNAFGDADCCSMIPGFKFELFEHPVGSYNGQHVLISVSTEAVQTPAYISDEEVLDAYVVSYVAIPHGSQEAAPYRPPRTTPKPVVRGTQTATVVGPAGEEIFTDKYGRVKVQFHWDREGKYDGGSSCWIRVAQPWSGKQWGTMFIPRIGMEVLVDFLEGDPDQPIIIGCVYNAENMPPYKLPDEKTKSTTKTNSTIGGGGFNEIRFEDKKGSEQIFVHGQKDQDIRIRNDRRELIGQDRHLIVKRDKVEQIDRDEHGIVKRDRIEKIKRDKHLKIEGKQTTEVGGSVSLKVGGDVAEKFGANHAEDTSGAIYLKAGMNVVIEAGMQITLKAGGGFVDIGPAGVTIQGTMVLINSGGAAGSGSPGSIVPPLDPLEAHIADNADPGSKAPTYKNQIKDLTPIEYKKLNAPTHKPSSVTDSSEEKKKSWIEIKLIDEDNEPVPGEEYLVTLPDGSTVASGTLDEKGFARVENVDPGSCKVTFPKRDGRSWKKA